MFELDKLLDNRVIDAEFLKDHIRVWFRTTRILIVVDGGIRITPAADPTNLNDPNLFGLSMVIAHLRSFSAGFASFSVTLATRNGAAATNASPGPAEFKYTGFRFDQGGPGDPVLDHYDQVWCFGLQPGNGPDNDPNSLNPAIDSVFAMAKYNPTSDAELAALTRWMNERQGGLFATGDHHTLGASMCSRIPRANTMRRWTVAQGTTTVELTTRYDTNQPATPQEASGQATIVFNNQSDATPQPVHWVPEYSSGGWLFKRQAPHPIFCHPSHGPIDVFPDHPHEGSCYEPGEQSWLDNQAKAEYAFAGYSGKHYPTVNGKRPLPKVIARGDTLASPPIKLAKGDQEFRTIPLVSVYDGQQIDLGRVVVDSTWHHWLDINLVGMQAAPNKVPFEKIMRYFVNVGIWLASPTWRNAMTLGYLKLHQFGYFGQQEYHPLADSVTLGLAAQTLLGRALGPCWVWHFNRDALRLVDIELEPIPKPGPWPCLTCPPDEFIDAVVLGELVKQVYADMPEAQRQLAETGRITAVRGVAKDPGELVKRAAGEASLTITRAWQQDLEHSSRHIAPFARVAEAQAKARPKTGPKKA